MVFVPRLQYLIIFEPVFPLERVVPNDPFSLVSVATDFSAVPQSFLGPRELETYPKDFESLKYLLIALSRLLPSAIPYFAVQLMFVLYHAFFFPQNCFHLI